MAGFPAPWCVAGGWAIDSFLGRVTRLHDDVELAIFRQDQLALHEYLGRWHFDKIVERRREPWAAGEFLELPIHEIHGRSPDEPAEAIEILLTQRDGMDWIFRRNSSVKLPLERTIIPSAIGLPILAPEIVLLYKSRSLRPKDESDFECALAALSPARRCWLAEALQFCAPSHPWRKLLRPIVVRPAVPADAASVVRTHFRAVHETARTSYPDHVLDGWSSPPDEARVARVEQGITIGQEMLVAEIEGLVCGFGSIVPEEGQLRAVYVDPAFGRRGIGSAILRELELLAVRRGVTRLSMDASLNAEAFYLKHGYAIGGRGMHRLSSGAEMDCVRMSKELSRYSAPYLCPSAPIRG
ncbi:MAG TPA: GNAT family N-acetyltransferase [Tepidisphaeraceae bacterium]|nr:GNAT family N-acetyltransferase [Tepidisphaeraceae bacterium]